MIVLPRLYNPREVPGELLEEMLVGRAEILQELLADLARQIHSASRQHWLLRGPRGIGKTHVLGVLYHRVLHDETLAAAYRPVWLGEADAYEAYSAGMLLLTVARRLFEELKSEKDGAAAELDAAIGDLPQGGDDPALFEGLCDLLKQQARSRRKILLVLMENLDALLEGFAKPRSNQEAGRLRALLSDDKELLFISTTPTRYLARLSSPKAPLFGHLRERRLDPMTEDDVHALFEKLARLTGRDLPAPGPDPGAEAQVRWRVLHRLSGGNPRAVVMAFGLLTGAPGVRAMVEELAALLDAHTPYFEARLARLAPRERAIVAAMALAPTNLTLAGIAKLTRLPERALSTQVRRLEQEGHLALAQGEKGKGAIHELTDGLFRVWYQFRKGQKLLLPLVRFMAMWHEPAELDPTLQSLRRELTELPSGFEREAARLAERQIAAAIELGRSAAGRAERERLWAECGSSLGAVGPDDRMRGAAALGQPLEVEVLRAEMERTAAGEAVAMFNLGATLGKLGRGDEAVAVYRKLIERFGSSEEPALREQVARAMFNLGGTFNQLGRLEEEAAAYRALIEQFGSSDEPALREQVARAMFNLGVRLGQLGRLEEEAAAHRALIEQFGSSEEPALKEPVARAMFALGLALGQLGRGEEAVAVYGKLLERFGESEEPALREQVARGKLNLGARLGQLGRDEEAVVAYRELIERFGRSDEPAVMEQVASAMFNLALTLRQLGRSEEEAAAYRELIERFGGSEQPALRQPVARAMFNLGVRLGQLGHLEEEAAAHRELIEQFGSSEEPALKEQVARAMFALGLALGQLGRGEEAVAACHEIVERFGSSEEPALREHVARAMFALGLTHSQLGRGEEEAAAYRALIERFGESEEPALREQVARALLYLGVTLGQLGRGEEAVAAYRDLIERFGSSEEPALREQVARALLARAQVLFLLQRPSEARAELKEAARLIAAGVPVGLESARTAIELLLVGLPTSEARSAVKQLAQSGDQSVSELARLHLLVVGVLEAEQGSGRAKGSRAARRKRALARVPVELRATVADAARRVARLREAAAADGGGSPG